MLRVRLQSYNTNSHKFKILRYVSIFKNEDDYKNFLFFVVEFVEQSFSSSNDILQHNNMKQLYFYGYFLSGVQFTLEFQFLVCLFS